jgi:hypothetical protein
LLLHVSRRFTISKEVQKYRVYEVKPIVLCAENAFCLPGFALLIRFPVRRYRFKETLLALVRDLFTFSSKVINRFIIV